MSLQHRRTPPVYSVVTARMAFLHILTNTEWRRELTWLGYGMMW